MAKKKADCSINCASILSMAGQYLKTMISGPCKEVSDPQGKANGVGGTLNTEKQSGYHAEFNLEGHTWG